MRPWIAASLIVLVMWLAACGGQEVSRADYGSSWPLTVESATLFCAEDAVWVLIDGDRYALNGWARTYKDLPALPRSLWRDNPAIPGLKIDIGVLIDAGLALCD